MEQLLTLLGRVAPPVLMPLARLVRETRGGGLSVVPSSDSPTGPRVYSVYSVYDQSEKEAGCNKL